MKIINIIVCKDGILHSNDAVYTDAPSGIITGGFKAGKSVEDVAEERFWFVCQEINKDIPDMEHADFESDMNLPDIDDGYYEHENMQVFLSTADCHP